MSRRLIYLHGFASGPGSSKAQFFRQRFRAAGLELDIPDLSEGDFERLTITGQLAVVGRIAAGRPAALIGSSLGGYLAALYAASHPEIERLVLLAPAFGFARRWPEVLGPEKMDRWKTEGALEVYHYSAGGPRRLHYGFIQDGLQYPDFPNFSQPALVFHGRRDTDVPVRYSEQFCRHHPNAKLEILDSDHQLLDAVDSIWLATSAFLQ